jgi:hypothetical protein
MIAFSLHKRMKSTELTFGDSLRVSVGRGKCYGRGNQWHLLNQPISSDGSIVDAPPRFQLQPERRFGPIKNKPNYAIYFAPETIIKSIMIMPDLIVLLYIIQSNICEIHTNNMNAIYSQSPLRLFKKF